MLAGDTNRRTVNASDFTNQAITFVCLSMLPAIYRVKDTYLTVSL